ncbi:MAG: cytochrome P450, partial [Actinomycetota bacterium]
LNLLMPAGAETTYRLLGSLLYALLSDPLLIERVRGDRSLIAPAIEETLRWEAPVQFVARRPTKDVSIGGVSIAAGTALTCVLGSANRDETVYEDPNRFDMERFSTGGKARPHLAFADGPHRCLGEHLARMETTVAVNALLDRMPNLRMEPGDADPHVHGLAFRSPTCLPVRFDA